MYRFSGKPLENLLKPINHSAFEILINSRLDLSVAIF